MKQLLIIAFFLTLCQTSLAQNFILKINGTSDKETTTIDSLNYTRKHQNIKSLEKEITNLSEKLKSIGYLDQYSKDIIQKNDSTFSIEFQLNDPIKYTYISLSENELLNPILNNFSTKKNIGIKYNELPTFLEETLKKVEQNGYPLAKLQLTNIKKIKNSLYADLNIKLNSQRKINQIVIKNNDAKFFPNNHIQQINKKFKNKLLNQNSLREIQLEFEKYPFANQTKKPQLLLSKDSTLIYVYAEKRKANTFDGYIGLGNNEAEKTTINGYLDIQLQNILKQGEEFFIYWKSDGNNQKTFRTGLTLDYLFKTTLGLNAQLHIFKQDSTFQNSKSLVNLNYIINYNSRLNIGIESTTSSDIQNSNNSVSDYTNHFFTTGLNYAKKDPNHDLFPEKTKIEFRFGIGKRNQTNILSSTPNQKQHFIHLNLAHNFYFNSKHSINLRSQNYFLKSDTYLTNELFRFGGLYSIRGFAENSLQANYLISLLSEYNYLINPNLNINGIIDFGTYKDLSNSSKTHQLKGFGLGLGVLTKKGMLKISITNGLDTKNNFQFTNSILQLSYNTSF
ncbi:hypothetical protein [Flavobacterium sp. TSSA_36]|uniref:hypothetical protein n=1 Tax=Flavobacterium sp. TSSA_36 TaxID=3447669 RepID=UPI003F39412B